MRSNIAADYEASSPTTTVTPVDSPTSEGQTARMALFEMRDKAIASVPRTTFAAASVLERKHLQAALRDDISPIGDDLLVVAEEFGEFDGANRRIDLLCVDRTGRLVVVELKRTEDGGHMDLQALRYAAMVSLMTRSDLVRIYERHLQLTGGDPKDAEQRLVDWTCETDDDELVVSGDVRIVLVSADFGKEITTTVLWLRDRFDVDIRCIRLRPHRLDDRLVLDIQPIVPLPEAEEFVIGVRRRQESVAAESSAGRDYSKFEIADSESATGPLNKRQAMRALVCALHGLGVDPALMVGLITGPKLLAVDGILDGDALGAAFVQRYPAAENNLGRWFVDSPLPFGDRTWVLSKMWGIDTETTLYSLLELAPEGSTVTVTRIDV